MHRFIETESFDIRPVEDSGTLIGHPVRIEQSLKRHIARRGRWLNLLEQFMQRKSDPRDHHGPTLDTSETINSLFERKLQQLIKIKNLRFIDKPVHRHRPRPRNKAFRSISNATLRRIELVKVVIVGNGVERC